MSVGSWKTGVGVNHVGAYQVSGRPFASASVVASSSIKVEFPKVTRWVQVHNRDPLGDCKVGFSENGVEGTENNYFFIIQSPPAGGVQVGEVLELKIGEIWLSGSGIVDVVAGLTNIDTVKLSGSTGTNWSGSIGVG